MAGKVLNINVCSPLKLRSGLTGKYHATCHYSYNLPWGASWPDKKDYTTMRLLLISILIAGPLGQLLACKCSGPPTIKESFDKVGLIIHGRVVNKEVVTYQETFNDVKG